MLQPVRFHNGCIELLDQTLLPHVEEWLGIDTVDRLSEAIRSLRVRGAPAIGIAAAYGMALAVRGASDHAVAMRRLRAAGETLAGARPTAVNLFWAIERMRRVARASTECAPEALADLLLAEARRLHAEDIRGNRRIGALGASLLSPASRVLTHCNTGALATGGYGTALGIVRTAWRRGRLREVIVDETRPLLQGARLTAWELRREAIPFRLIVDAAAGSIIRDGRVDAVFVGADRIAANGDVANKIGSYPLAVLARRHRVPFLSVAPISTIDPATASGNAIPIELRDPSEVCGIREVRLAPEGVEASNPAFDVVPHDLITAIVTERGVLRPPYGEAIRRVLAA